MKNSQHDPIKNQMSQHCLNRVFFGYFDPRLPHSYTFLHNTHAKDWTEIRHDTDHSR